MGIHGNTSRFLCGQVMNVYLRKGIVAGRCEVSGVGFEYHKETVGCDPRKGTITIALIPIGIDRDASCLSSGKVMHECLRVSVRALVGEVGGGRMKDHQSSVGGDGGLEA